MLLLLVAIHVSCALLSLGSMTVAVASRWHERGSDHAGLLRLSGYSFGGLLASGIILVLRDHSALGSACSSGLLYLVGLLSLYVCYVRLAQAK